jgi:tetratricopeptide (TPR) repeat protein
LTLASQVAKSKDTAVVRDFLVAGDVKSATALLDAVASSGSDMAIRDQAMVWFLQGEGADRAREAERQSLKAGKSTALLAVHLYRLLNDLKGARRVAEQLGDKELLGEILHEQQDYQALAKLSLSFYQSSPSRLAVLLYHAGDMPGYDSALKQIPANSHDIRSQIQFFTDQPSQAIESTRKTNRLSAVCKWLALQGRYREALELTATAQAPGNSDITRLQLEQAVLAQSLGETEKATQLLKQGLASAEKNRAQTLGLLATVYNAGVRMNRREEVLALVSGVLDALKEQTPTSLLREVSKNDADALLLWWAFLRKKNPEDKPSATLRRLVRWFVEGKAGDGFDKLMEAQNADGIPADKRAAWASALSRACVVVGKTKKAEQLLVAETKREEKRGSSAIKVNAYLDLGDFYYQQQNWEKAEKAYQAALERDKTNALTMYLVAAALGKKGPDKKSKELSAKARLLSLADETARYTLAQELGTRGLDAINDERVLMLRGAPFRSVYATNAAASLAAVERKSHPLTAARYYRQVYLNLAFGGGAFMDSTAYLRVPAFAHRYQAMGLIAAGKLDEARKECELAQRYLPLESDLVIDLVGALDRARRKGDADAVFADALARHNSACADFPKSAMCHNRFAWLAVRCGRDLGKALEHAQKATKLRPEAAGYLDTLAEVHFQRGEKKEAIAAIQRAIKLAPRNRYYQAQMKRFEAGDPRAALPEQ